MKQKNYLLAWGQTSLRLLDELEEEIESKRFYGDSKSEWIRHAIKMRQHVNPILDEMYESYQNESGWILSQWLAARRWTN